MNKEKYRFWKDKHIDDGRELEIRTCLECKFSECKTDDGEWVSYLTVEKMQFTEDYFKKYMSFYNCKSCMEF